MVYKPENRDFCVKATKIDIKNWLTLYKFHKKTLEKNENIW